MLSLVVIVGFGLAAEKPGKEERLVKITLKRIPMDERLLTLCVGPGAVVGPHDSAEVDVYMNPVALDYRKAHPKEFDYPVGSIFVKKKYPKVGARDADVETIMVKRKSDGVVGDWEFSMRSLPDHKPIKPAARVSCADCHQKYAARGFISRESEEALQGYLQSLNPGGDERPAGERGPESEDGR